MRKQLAFCHYLKNGDLGTIRKIKSPTLQAQGARNCSVVGERQSGSITVEQLEKQIRVIQLINIHI